MILFEIPLRGSGEKISYRSITAVLASTFAGLLMLVLSVGLTGTGLLGVPFVLLFYVLSALTLYTLLTKEPKHRT